jgi:hypothetical protein
MAILNPGIRQSAAQVVPTQMQPVRMAPMQAPLTTATPAPRALAQGRVVQSAPARVSYEQRDGIQYQVIRRIVKRQVPVTVIQNRSQTVYRQQAVPVPGHTTSYLAWVPETKTVQVPVTAYRTVEEEVITRVAMSGPPTATSTRPSTARQLPSGPSATLAALSDYQPESNSVSPGMGPMGGATSRSTPSRQGKGWQMTSQGQGRH